MDKKCPNLYQRARLSTGMSQERAAELIGLSPESLKQYEGGKTVPKDETVAKMVEVYSCPWLALEHAQATDTLGVMPEVNVQSLPTAAITLINRVLDFAERHRDRQLLRIAEDGIIDEKERPDFDAICRDLDGIVGAALQVKYPSDAPPKTKKERPEAATSERSGKKCVVLDQPLDVSIIAQDPRRMQDLILPGRGYPCDRLGNVFHGRRRWYRGGNPAADRGSDGKIRGQYGRA